jgi:hypothetical protein
MLLLLYIAVTSCSYCSFTDPGAFFYYQIFSLVNIEALKTDMK